MEIPAIPRWNMPLVVENRDEKFLPSMEIPFIHGWGNPPMTCNSYKARGVGQPHPSAFRRALGPQVPRCHSPLSWQFSVVAIILPQKRLAGSPDCRP